MKWQDWKVSSNIEDRRLQSQSGNSAYAIVQPVLEKEESIVQRNSSAKPIIDMSQRHEVIPLASWENQAAKEILGTGFAIEGF